MSFALQPPSLGSGLAACSTLARYHRRESEHVGNECHTYAFAKEYVANANQPAAYGNPLNRSVCGRD